MITVSAFRWVPDLARGLVKDLRVRWALEEAGLPYETWLIGLEEKNSPAYRELQPFGQVPAYEEDGFVLFESGAIVHYIASKSEALMPADEKARARVVTWMFAALNSIEPFMQNLLLIDFAPAGQEWAKQGRPATLQLVQSRLDALAQRLDGRDYLEDGFTAADLIMTTVLRMPRHTDLVAQIPVLDAYKQRCEARPAFQRALAAQMADFEERPAAVA